MKLFLCLIYVGLTLTSAYGQGKTPEKKDSSKLERILFLGAKVQDTSVGDPLYIFPAVGYAEGRYYDLSIEPHSLSDIEESLGVPSGKLESVNGICGGVLVLLNQFTSGEYGFIKIFPHSPLKPPSQSKGNILQNLPDSDDKEIDARFSKTIQVLSVTDGKSDGQVRSISKFDFDNDGRSEYIKVVYGGGLAQLGVGNLHDYNSRNFKLSHNLTNANAPISMNDFTGDGIPEIIVGITSENQGMGVEIFEWRWPRFESVFKKDTFNCR